MDSWEVGSRQGRALSPFRRPPDDIEYCPVSSLEELGPSQDCQQIILSEFKESSYVPSCPVFQLSARVSSWLLIVKGLNRTLARCAAVDWLNPKLKWIFITDVAK